MIGKKEMLAVIEGENSQMADSAAEEFFAEFDLDEAETVDFCRYFSATSLKEIVGVMRRVEDGELVGREKREALEEVIAIQAATCLSMLELGMRLERTRQDS